jgi:hypothetical protein
LKTLLAKLLEKLANNHLEFWMLQIYVMTSTSIWLTGLNQTSWLLPWELQSIYGMPTPLLYLS